MSRSSQSVAAKRFTQSPIPSATDIGIPIPEIDNDENTREAIAFLALASLRGVGYWTLWNLKTEGHNFNDVFRLDSRTDFLDVLRAAKARLQQNETVNWPSNQERLWKKAQEDLKRLAHFGVRLIFRDNPLFPSLLQELPDAPFWLFVQGDINILRHRSVAIVGTRKPHHDGLFLANYIASLTATLGLGVVSGLADGIDTIAHRHSLRFRAQNVAILGTGILFHLGHATEELRRGILRSGGAVVSEYLPDQRYSAEFFVRRNRLQAGLVRTVIPVEWAVDGGTAHTVRFASRYERRIIGLRLPDWDRNRPELAMLASLNAPVFSVPGSEHELIDYLLQASDNVLPTYQQLKLF